MPLIQTVSPAQAQGQVAEIYRQIESALGRVPNAFQLYSSNPALLALQWSQVAYYLGHPSLSFPLLGCIRMLVSQHNKCDYCIDFNAAMLMEHAGFTTEQIADAKWDPAATPLPAKDLAMLLFVLKATRLPQAVNPGDIEALREMGWSDGDILDATTHGARNMAADVVFNAFKIEQD